VITDVVGSSGGGGISGRGWVGGVAGGDGVPGSGDAVVFISRLTYSAFKEVMSMEKRYSTSDLAIRS
jgi:hypothetical protein